MYTVDFQMCCLSSKPIECGLCAVQQFLAENSYDSGEYLAAAPRSLIERSAWCLYV